MRQIFSLGRLAAATLALGAGLHARPAEAGGRRSFGGRTQVGALVRELDRVTGRRAPAQRPSLAARAPLTNRIGALLRPGLRVGDEQRRLDRFVRDGERRWGAPVTALRRGELPTFDRFRAEKALALTRLGRTPAEVTEGLLDARGAVDGEAIAPRRIFWQRWRPAAAPSGKLIVVSPGFQETGRSFYEQIQLLNRQGHDVVVMDHQWAGYSGGRAGAVDRGYGVARDVAAVSALAAELAERDYRDHPGRQVILFGNSMGAGPGVLAALALNDAGRLRLDGPRQMPEGLSAVLQAPFLGTSPSLLNRALGVLGRVPGLRDAPLPATGLPPLTHDPIAAERFASRAALEDVRARASALGATTADMARVRGYLDEGELPHGRLFVIHADRDPLADPARSRALVERLGARGRLKSLASRDHILEESPKAQGHVVEAIAWLSVATTR